MLAFHHAWDVLKASRQFQYGVYDYPEDPSAMQVAGTIPRDSVVKPGPMPGFVYYSGQLMSEQDAEKKWPSHIGTKAFMAPTKIGLGRYADAASFRMTEDMRRGEPDTDFREQRTVDDFLDDVAPGMAHETMHALDNQFGQGSFAQQELPAHVLERATQAVIDERRGYPSEPILPAAMRQLRNRPEFAQSVDNPEYEYDITDDTIITGAPMNLAFRMLKHQ